MHTQGMIGFSGSETSACSGNDSSGMRTPAIAITTLVLPAATTPIFLVAIVPRVVSTPRHGAEASRRIALTSQFWMMSTPRAEAARAKPQATASWRAVPPRALQGGADDGIADARIDVEDRAELLRLLGRQPFVGNAGKAIGVDVAFERLLVVMVVREQHDAARREHHVVVELLRQRRPEPVGVAVNALGGLPKVVRADDRRVAAGIAAASQPFSSTAMLVSRVPWPDNRRSRAHGRRRRR